MKKLILLLMLLPVLVFAQFESSININDSNGAITTNGSASPITISNPPFLDMDIYTRVNNTQLADKYGNNIDLLFPIISRESIARFQYTDTNGDLDIGASDFTIAGWVKTESTSATIRYIFGKNSTSSVTSGVYAVYASPDGDIKFKFTSGGAYEISSGANFFTGEWIFILAEINQTSGIAKLFINNTLADSVAFTGSFSTPVQTSYPFLIGSGVNFTGSIFYQCVKSFHADTYVYNKVLTVAEKLKLYNREIVQGTKAHWAFNDCERGNDYSGNGINLTAVDEINMICINDKQGSTISLNCGYSLYSNIGNDIRIQVPNSDNCSQILNPVVPSGYVFEKNVAGDSLYHNLAESMLLFTQEEFNRDDTDRYNPFARFNYGNAHYDADYPYAFDPEELNQLSIHNMKNVGYRNEYFPILETNSITDRSKLLSVKKYNKILTEDQSKVVMAKNDSDIIYEYTLIDSFTSGDHVSFVRDDKILSFNETTNTINLSLDNGTTVYNSLVEPSMYGIITFSYIFENGNILFANQNNMWLSKDSLQTSVSSDIIGYDGNPYDPSPEAYEVYRCFNVDKLYPDSLPLVWGNYKTASETIAHIWVTEDQGETITELLRFGTSIVGGSVIEADHTHSVTYDTSNDIWRIATGDFANKCNWINLSLDAGVYTFEVIKSGDGSSRFKSVGLIVYDGYLYWASDTDVDAYKGIFRVKLEDIQDEDKYERIFVSDKEMTSLRISDDGTLIANGNSKGRIITSSDRINFKVSNIDATDIQGFFNSYILTYPRDSRGRYLCEIFEDTEPIREYTNGKSVFLSIKEN